MGRARRSGFHARRIVHMKVFKSEKNMASLRTSKESLGTRGDPRVG